MCSRAAVTGCRSRTRSTRSCAPSPRCWSLPLDPCSSPPRCAAAPVLRRMPQCRHARRARLPRARAQKAGDNQSCRTGLRGSGQGLAATRIRRQRGCTPRQAICGSPPTSRPRRRSISTRRSRCPGSRREQRGEALLDRARAAEAQGDYKTARASANEAAATISGDPFYWYFSAALAIREGDHSTAPAAIGNALTLAPDGPAILFEAGHVADFNGDDDTGPKLLDARGGQRPDGPAGRAAAKAVEMLGVTPTVKTEATHRTSRSAQVVIDRRHDADLLEGRAAARRAAIVAILAVACANREIALARRLDAADRAPLSRANSSALRRALWVASAIISGFSR